MELEDKQFEDYANRVIDYLGKHGRNTYPMKKVTLSAIKFFAELISILKLGTR
jgi:hypothetical protein